MAKAERFALTHIREVYEVRDLADLGELLALASSLEEGLEFDRHVKVILDRVLSAAGDQDDVRDARADRFFDAVLDDRLVDQREHLFGLGLGRRKETCAETSRRKNGL